MEKYFFAPATLLAHAAHLFCLLSPYFSFLAVSSCLVCKNFLIFVAHYSATLFGDEYDFELHNFPEKATTTKVCSGGWALYSEPDFKGKVLYQMGSE